MYFSWPHKLWHLFQKRITAGIQLDSNSRLALKRSRVVVDKMYYLLGQDLVPTEKVRRSHVLPSREWFFFHPKYDWNVSCSNWKTKFNPFGNLACSKSFIVNQVSAGCVCALAFCCRPSNFGHDPNSNELYDMCISSANSSSDIGTAEGVLSWIISLRDPNTKFGGKQRDVGTRVCWWGCYRLKNALGLRSAEKGILAIFEIAFVVFRVRQVNHTIHCYRLSIDVLPYRVPDIALLSIHLTLK